MKSVGEVQLGRAIRAILERNLLNGERKKSDVRAQLNKWGVQLERNFFGVYFFEIK